MSKSDIYLNMEQLNLIRYLENKIDNASPLQTKLNQLISRLISTPNTTGNVKCLSDLRLKHHPTITAEFLSSFGDPNGLKFLTHDFDPDSSMTMATVVKQVSSIIDSKKYIYKLPGSLYALFINFLRGERKWYDYNNASHHTNLNTGGLKNWIDSNPTLHPISSNQYGNEIQDFRKTVRISKPVLPELISSFIRKKTGLQNLQIKMEKLDKADFYTNVNCLINCILGKVLEDIAQRDPPAEVMLSYDRSTWNEYRLCKIIITHIGSEANPFGDVQKKIFSGGGALYELAKYCQGYCDWTVEANFEGEYKRWRILSAQNLPEIETMAKNEIKGFTHIFTFYKY